MSGEEQLFNIVAKKDLGSITFGDNLKVRAIGIISIRFFRFYLGGAYSTYKRFEVQSPEHKSVM